jgi:hypothetical protein
MPLAHGRFANAVGLILLLRGNERAQRFRTAWVKLGCRVLCQACRRSASKQICRDRSTRSQKCHKRTLGCSSVELVDHVVAVDWGRCGVGEANRLGPF